MKTILRTLLILAVVALATLPGVRAQSLTAVSVSPATVNINDSGLATLTLRWAITVVGPTAPGSVVVVVSSPSGTLTIPGPPAASAGGPLAGSVTFASPGGTKVLRLTERVAIPRAQAQAIVAAGSATFTRTFTGSTGGSQSATVTLRASSGGVLSVGEAALRFDDGSRYRVVEQGSALSAEMRLSTTGRGILEGTWQIAGPSAANPNFRPLGRVRKLLAGSRFTLFESPTLPTDVPGLYTVRFVPAAGAGSAYTDNFPQIRYSVTGGEGAGALPLRAPVAGAAISPATLFEWGAVPGAARYRLEFLEAGSRAAALDLRGTSTQVRAFTLQRLSGTHSLTWRVLAFDAGGNLLAASPQRSLDDG